MAEGSFGVKKRGDFFFNIKQRTHINLFEAIKLVFKTERKLDGIGTPYLQFSVSSVKDIERVIQFFSFSNLHPLIGYKLKNYNEWIKRSFTI